MNDPWRPGGDLGDERQTKSLYGERLMPRGQQRLYVAEQRRWPRPPSTGPIRTIPGMTQRAHGVSAKLADMVRTQNSFHSVYVIEGNRFCKRLYA